MATLQRRSSRLKRWLLSAATLAAALSTGRASAAVNDPTAPPFAVTSSKAPASRTLVTPKPIATPVAPPTVVVAAEEPAPPVDDGKIPHRGFVADANVGALGCFATTCAQRHDAQPGVHVGGFIGGNIRGWVSLGVSGGWGTIRPRVPAGSDALGLYGLDAATLVGDLDVPEGYAAPMDLTLFTVRRAQLRAAHAGPLVRVHFIPRGRVTAWVGSGAHYNYVESKYDTPVGDVAIALHGLAVPIEAGLGVYLTRHLAVTAQFDYLWSWYALTRLRAPGQNLVVPVRMLDDAGAEQGAEFAGGLPHLWTVGFGLRARL